jgi:hypothetical protein
MISMFAHYLLEDSTRKGQPAPSFSGVRSLTPEAKQTTGADQALNIRW